MNDAGELKQSVDDTLKQRGTRYGEFKNHANLSTNLKDKVFGHQAAFGSSQMSKVQQEAMSMILHKIARIANGDPNYIDSWTDIAGYAQLVVDDLEEK